MKCPVDDTEMTSSERQSIDIDICPTCRGVWLDGGELDALLERVGTPRGTSPLADETTHTPDDEQVAPMQEERGDNVVDEVFGGEEKGSKEFRTQERRL